MGDESNPEGKQGSGGQGVTVALNGRTLWFLAAFLGGGVMGGGGASYAVNPTDEVQNLNTKVDQLKEGINQLTIQVAEFKASLNAGFQADLRIEKRVEDHEKRLRKLEGLE